MKEQLSPIPTLNSEPNVFLFFVIGFLRNVLLITFSARIERKNTWNDFFSLGEKLKGLKSPSTDAVQGVSDEKISFPLFNLV